MTKREELIRNLEEQARYHEVQAQRQFDQAYWCREIAGKMRNGEDITGLFWTCDIMSTEQWYNKYEEIEAEEQLNERWATA